jgi:hypothetical protein
MKVIHKAILSIIYKEPYPLKPLVRVLKDLPAFDNEGVNEWNVVKAVYGLVRKEYLVQYVEEKVTFFGITESGIKYLKRLGVV